MRKFIFYALRSKWVGILLSIFFKKSDFYTKKRVDINHIQSTFQTLKKIDQEAKDFGFYWESIEGVFQQIDSECQEVLDEFKERKKLQEEIGDLFHAIICGIHFLAMNLTDDLVLYTQQGDQEMRSQSCFSEEIIQESKDHLLSIQKNIQILKCSKIDNILMQKIFKDIFHQACQISCKNGYMIHDTLRQGGKKFQNRFNIVKDLAHKKDITNLHQLSVKEKIELWKEAKILLNQYIQK